MDEIVYKPIGVNRSPHKEVEGMPIQPSGHRVGSASECC
jgi:hypothetical protein